MDKTAAMNERLRKLIAWMKAGDFPPPTPGLAALANQPALLRRAVNWTGRPYPDETRECDQCQETAVCALWYDWIWLCQECGGAESPAWPGDGPPTWPPLPWERKGG